MQKINLVLSGGAARGAFHLGVLEALREKEIEIAAISGSSIGAIIGASYASGVTPREQLEIFSSKAFRKAFKFNSLFKGFITIDKQKEIIKKLIPVDRLEDMSIPISITTIDLVSGQIIRFNSGNAIDIAIASGSIAPIFAPVYYDNYALIDGGIMDNFPIEPLKSYGLPIYGVDLHPQQFGYTDSVGGTIKRMLFLMWRASVQKQIQSCDLYITDEALLKYPLFRIKNLDALFSLGYERALELLDK